MKKMATLLALAGGLWAGAQAPTQGYEITVTLKPLKNQYIYLGHYYGKQLPILDSALLDGQSKAVFKGKQPLGAGIYLIGFPDRANRFEFLVGKNQRFGIVADTARLTEMAFVGSAENNAFKSYQSSMAREGEALDGLLKRRSGATGRDSVRLTAQVDSVSKQMDVVRRSAIAKDPNGLLATLLRAMKEPDVPVNPAAAAKDSLYAYKYFKSHYWDGVNFWDDRVLRTPFFEPRLEKYFEQLVYPSPDSVIREMDWMLGYASASEEMQKFLLLKFVNRYLNMKYMWEDAVFVHLFEKYFANKSYPWLTDKGRKMITDRAYNLMANILGSPAADMELPDSTGKTISLYSVEAPHTLVVVYDPNCGHCKETLPRIDSLYRVRWAAAGLKVYAVAKQTEDGKRQDWLNFLHTHGLAGWTHVYYTKEAEAARVAAGRPSYMQLYDVQSFPTLFLLDKDKRIVAKKLTEKQVDEILAQRAKATARQ